MKTGYELLNDPFLNKGTAFSHAEREKYALVGLLPSSVQSIDEQATQAYAQYSKKLSPIEKRLFLMQIFNTNRTLFYKLFSLHIKEMMPVVYDPVIATSIEHYSELFIQPQNALFLDINDTKSISSRIKNAAAGRKIELVVATDAEGILGIGDWGVQGVDISIGKLMVYTAAAGIDPKSVLPIVLDVGTDRQELLDSPLYLGARHARVRGERYYKFIDEFVSALRGELGDVYLHWEDFGRENALNVLNRFNDKFATFNDDIQGTGIVSLAAILGALKISGEKLTEQRYVCFGAGSAGCGIAHRVYTEMRAKGLSEDEAKSRFYLVDKQGLLFSDDSTLTPAQREFAKDRAEFSDPDSLTSLEAVVKAVRPSILVGTSTVGGAFTKTVLSAMAQNAPRPIIMPLSNPTELAEATAKDILAATDARALVATGIPADDVSIGGTTFTIGQANNALIYPGLGLGVIASKASRLSDAMISAAAHAVAALIHHDQKGAAVLPSIERIRDFSHDIARAVANVAIDEGLSSLKKEQIEQAIKDKQWQPEYKELG